MIRTMAAMAAALLFLGVGTADAASSSACNRACLKGMLTTYLDALVKRDPAAAPFSRDVRFTENIADLKLGEGLWKGASGLGTYRQDFLDVRAGIAGSHVVVLEEGKPVLVALRLKVVGGRITEVETQVTRNVEEGALLDMAALVKADPAMDGVLPANKRTPRNELIRLTRYYGQGLIAGSFVKVDAPFAEGTNRQENGVWTAGPKCTRAETCKNIKTQPSPTRSNFQERVIAVDEEAGIVWYRYSWARGANTRLVAFENFKVYDGKMQAVEAFLRFAPLASRSGWD